MPVRLTSTTALPLLVVSSSNGIGGALVPALLKSRSRRPNFFLASSGRAISTEAGIRHVGRNDERPARAGRRLLELLAPASGERDVVAGLQQRLRHRPADAAAGARHDRNLRHRPTFVRRFRPSVSMMSPTMPRARQEGSARSASVESPAQRPLSGLPYCVGAVPRSNRGPPWIVSRTGVDQHPPHARETSMEYVNLGRTGPQGLAHLPRLHELRRASAAPCNGCSTRRRAARSSSKRSKPGSTSSTRPTSIRSASSEEITGRALKDFAKRDEVVIATKVFSKMSDDPNGRGLSRKHIMQRDRRQPAAARHRLRRPLPDASLGRCRRRSRRRSRR